MIGFFADDLTGATDVLAQAHAYGLDAALVLDPASGLPDAEVAGVAGTARSLADPELSAAVRAGLAVFDDPEVLLYKVCSTFDSSPTVGSIGRGVELLHERFPGHGPVPVVPAQPGFGRYTAFGNHFGRSGDGVHRLDRHPVMSRHPSTPMHEADLRRVLSAQLTGGAAVPGIHLPVYDDGTFGSSWSLLRDGRAPAFVVDAVTESHLDTVAAALLAGAGPSVVVGSGGIMGALARARGRSAPVPPSGAGSSGPTLVVSASASAVTAGQIDDAVSRGWVGVPVSLDPPTEPDTVTAALRAGRDVVAYTAHGPDDLRESVDPAVAGARVGRLAADAVAAGLTRDVMICGGDTSGHALAALGVRELRVADLFVPVAPVCRTDDDSVLAGCRLVLKGGQVGPPDVFHRFAMGVSTT